MANIRKRVNTYQIRSSCGYDTKGNQVVQTTTRKSEPGMTPRQIQQFINDLSRNKKNRNTGKPLSRKTVVHHMSFISDVFSYAVKAAMLTDNPCSRESVPKRREERKADIHD